MKKILIPVCVVFLLSTTKLYAQSSASAPLTIENYYKIKWGCAEEFISLWKKNHYPLLKKLKEKGDILDIKAEAPIIHSGEDTRWDFKVTITFKTEHLALDYSIVDHSKSNYSPIRKIIKKLSSIALSLLSHTGMSRSSPFP